MLQARPIVIIQIEEGQLPAGGIGDAGQGQGDLVRRLLIPGYPVQSGSQAQTDGHGRRSR